MVADSCDCNSFRRKPIRGSPPLLVVARCLRWCYAIAMKIPVLLISGLIAGCGSSDDAGSADAAASADSNGSAIDSGGGADSSGGVDSRLLPAASGRMWTYQVSAVGGGSVCAPGTHSDQILGEETIDGRNAFEVSGWCSAVGTTLIAVDGDKAEARYQGGWIVVLDVPVQDGHTWTSTGPVSYTWRDHGTVTVPAGTFDDCWKRDQNVSYTAYTIYCRGVGATVDYSEDLAGNGWHAQLTATNF